jgi:hypothetical protein
LIGVGSGDGKRKYLECLEFGVRLSEPLIPIHQLADMEQVNLIELINRFLGRLEL